MTLFPMAIITLFWKDQIGLSLSEILLLQAFFSVTCVMLEYPSGYISDRLGYRTALILASGLAIVGWSLYTFADSFSEVLVAELILGASWAFISGSDNALLFETLRYKECEEQYATYDGRMASCAQTGEAMGALAAGVMYAYWPLLPFLCQIVVWSVCLLLCLSFFEPPGEATISSHSHLSEALATCHLAFRQSNVIRSTIFLGTVLGLSSFYTVWLIQPYMQLNEVPVEWFGPVWAGANLSVALGAMLSQRVITVLKPAGSVLLFAGMVATGYLGLSLAGGTWCFLFYYVLTLMRGIQGPYMRSRLQNAGNRANRASILSLHSLSFRLCFVLTGPLVGIGADQLGLRATFALLALLFMVFLLPLSVFFVRTHSKS